MRPDCDAEAIAGFLERLMVFCRIPAIFHVFSPPNTRSLARRLPRSRTGHVLQGCTMVRMLAVGILETRSRASVSR